jgi:hypothetical protein
VAARSSKGYNTMSERAARPLVFKASPLNMTPKSSRAIVLRHVDGKKGEVYYP